MTQQPHNAEGEVPSRTAREAASRLNEKIRELRGEANRRRAIAEAARVLGVGDQLTPRNEEGEAPTSTAREAAARLEGKMLQQRGSANKRRTAAKIRSL